MIFQVQRELMPKKPFIGSHKFGIPWYKSFQFDKLKKDLLLAILMDEQNWKLKVLNFFGGKWAKNHKWKRSER